MWLMTFKQLQRGLQNPTWPCACSHFVRINDPLCPCQDYRYTENSYFCPPTRSPVLQRLPTKAIAPECHCHQSFINFPCWKHLLWNVPCLSFHSLLQFVSMNTQGSSPTASTSKARPRLEGTLQSRTLYREPRCFLSAQRKIRNKTSPFFLNVMSQHIRLISSSDHPTKLH